MVRVGHGGLGMLRPSPRCFGGWVRGAASAGSLLLCHQADPFVCPWVGADSIEDLLSGLFGRSVGSPISSFVDGHSEGQVYLFTHETLQPVVQQKFGNSLAAYREQLHVWADSYQGLPVDTPRYLLHRYSNLLGRAGDLPRLVSCATNQLRHDRIRRLTGGDALAFNEISTAQQRSC